jgi:hypothetical protein
LFGVVRDGPQCCDKNGNKQVEPLERNAVRIDVLHRDWIQAYLTIYSIQKSFYPSSPKTISMKADDSFELTGGQ